ncbi:type II secretion system F family protein [Geoalkalibacter halelectricus]|uniref:Type II secretion system F family protein n=1 Tax=Geoalkalibacter halelectricus TaxID=2847045 RepID=A0ABY5ZND5_9BACT|nr:type II secretion system F family protein [Geoalkalibacter halelectricus]MDO3378434.1 type II secretion system F family protein [Geoalkalibacter halelectricus]UWZ80246.1 type II secretion system F family protein [Geoalkalibacter halelectricus]
MDFLTIFILAAVFLFVFSLISHLYLWWADSRFAQRQVIKRRLLNISAGGRHGEQRFDLYKEKALRDVSPMARLFYQLPRWASLDRLLVGSRTSLNASTFLLLSLSLGLGGLLLGLRFLPHGLAALLLGCGMAALPALTLNLAMQKTRRLFFEQLPDCLDLMARAVRTGHAMSSAMEIVVGEMDDPIRADFAAAVDEIKFGIPVDDALENMCERVTLTELRYFAITVIIHKETGGNIAQNFDNLSKLIRERLQFQRQIKALTAEGRLSAAILFFLPIAMALYLYVVNFDYLSLLWLDPFGKVLISAALVAQVAGFFVMRRMVAVEI